MKNLAGFSPCEVSWLKLPLIAENQLLYLNTTGVKWYVPHLVDKEISYHVH